MEGWDQEEWKTYGTCLSTPGDWFTFDPVQELRCKVICGTCPVAVDCLDFAVQTRCDEGIWGGLNKEERRRIRRRLPHPRSPEYEPHLITIIDRYTDAAGRLLDDLDHPIHGPKLLESLTRSKLTERTDLETAASSLDLDLEPLDLAEAAV